MSKPTHWPAGLRICLVFLFFVTGSAGALGQASALDECTRALYRGDYTKASEVATAHLRKSPGDVPVRVVLARAEMAQTKFEKAFENLRRALAFDPKNIDALFYLSVVSKDLSQKENQRLFFLAPDSDRVHQLLGEAALVAANESEAETEFEKAMNANPRSVTVLTEMAELKRSQFKFDEAINYYSRAERLDPTDYEIAYGLGSCYVSKQEFSGAIEWLRKTVALAPRFPAGHFALGNALFQNSQSEEAIPELKASVRMDPSMTQAYFVLGNAYAKLGRREEAKAVFQKLKDFNSAEMHGEVKPKSTPPAKHR